MNPNIGREIASKQAQWLIQLKKLIERQAPPKSPPTPTAAQSKVPGTDTKDGSPTASDVTEIVEPEMGATKANTMDELAKGICLQMAPLDYPRYTLDPAFITDRFVCPSLSKYVLPQWMLDEMTTISYSIGKTPRSLPRFRKCPIPAASDPAFPDQPIVVGDVPTVAVEDLSTHPVAENIPTLPVIEDMPTLPAIEEPISERALRSFPSTTSHTPPKVPPEPVEVDNRFQRKRKRAESGALERAVCKASLIKRRKQEGEVREKENMKLKKRKLNRHAMDGV